MDFKNVSKGTIFIADYDEHGKEISKIVKADKNITLSKKAYEYQKDGPLFLKGYIVAIGEVKAKENIIEKITVNALTSKQIKELLNNKISIVLQRLRKIDAPITLERIKAKTKKKTIIKFIDKKLEKLQ